MTRPLSWRIEQLTCLKRLLVDNEAALLQALKADLGRPEFEAWATDINPAIKNIECAIKNISGWAKPRKVHVPVAFQPAKAYVMAEPLGVCLVLAPWNYPIQLLLSPIAAAIAAGNSVVAKPSEYAPDTATLLCQLARDYLDNKAIQFVEGDADVSAELLTNKFDHIFFTGSSSIGRKVARAAAESLTPVTLELGGKTPTLVDESADVELAAKRIAWGKFINAGQSCIAPDFVLVESTVFEQFVESLAKSVNQFFGDDPQQSSDYGRVVNRRHFDRLSQLLEDPSSGQRSFGGSVDAEDLYISPTVMTSPDLSSSLMTDEIFGPLLPVLQVESVAEAIDLINERPKPLALYLFSRSASVKKAVLHQTSSGSLVVNHTMFQLAIPDLPFGGVGPSGFGRYHGQSGFDTFSNLKSVVEKPFGPEPNLIYPPTSKVKTSLLRRILR